MSLKGLAPFFFLLALTASCGYRLAGKTATLPGGATEIAVPLMKNSTLEVGLEDILTQELRRQLLADGRVGLRPEADFELRGAITQLVRTPLSFSSLGRVSVERVQVSAEFKLVKVAEGKAVWQSGEISADEEYPVAADPLSTERARERAERETAEDLAETALEMLLGDF